MNCGNHSQTSISLFTSAASNRGLQKYTSWSGCYV